MPNLVGPLDFFVYVIESPSALDLYRGRSEGQLLAQATALNGIPCVNRIAINRQAFEAALYVGLPEAMKDHPGAVPILHLSAHGAVEGLGLSDQQFLTWEDLRQLLHPVNAALNRNLVVCMSSCSGFSACRMAMRLDEAEMSFHAVVGHAGTPLWSDTAVAYSAFYHHIAKGAHIRDAVKAMKVAAGDQGFGLIFATDARQSYLYVISGQNAQEAREELEQVAEQGDLSDLTKLLGQHPRQA